MVCGREILTLVGSTETYVGQLSQALTISKSTYLQRVDLSGEDDAACIDYNAPVISFGSSCGAGDVS